MQMSVDITIKLFSGLAPPHFWKRDPRFSNFFLTLNFIVEASTSQIFLIEKESNFEEGNIWEKKLHGVNKMLVMCLARWKNRLDVIQDQLEILIDCGPDILVPYLHIKNPTWHCGPAATLSHMKSTVGERIRCCFNELSSLCVYVSQTGIYDGAYLK